MIDARQEIMRLAALLEGGHPAQLEHEARLFLQADPDSALGWQLLAHALGRQGKDPLGAWQKATACNPDDGIAHNNLGNTYARRGLLDAAAGCYRRAITLRPDLADAHANLALCLIGLARDEEAIPALHCALELDPGNVEARLNLAAAQRRIGQLEAAAVSCRAALAQNPRLVPALTGLATVLRLQRRSTEAIAACERALALEPAATAPLTVLADTLADEGRFADAEAIYRRCIDLEPHAVTAWTGLAQLRRFSVADSAWLRGAQRLAEAGLPARQEMHLRHALGKYCDDVGDYDAAFSHYRRANELARHCGPAHDRAALSRAVDHVMRLLDGDWIARMRGRGNDSPRPVFIVGMLRSGTTLAEQILASHGSVHGAGELSYWGKAWTALGAAPDGDTLRRLADDYLVRADALSPTALRIVDKMPTNFLVLGLIAAALPRARFIHLRRNPLDTCLSIYFQHFEAVNTYTNDLGDLAHYAQLYRRLMQHWRTVVPAGTVLDIDYEDLVADVGTTARRMVEFIGLPWEPQCLDYHRSSRSVVTASRWQVRQPIYRGSVGRWRHYEKFIGPLAALREERPGAS
jgi:tetratricopeptide (TPR) repeat protein